MRMQTMSRRAEENQQRVKGPDLFFKEKFRRF